MNDWKESDWFKNWLVLARHGENAVNRAEEPAGGWSSNNRNITPANGAGPTVPTPEWQVTE